MRSNVIRKALILVLVLTGVLLVSHALADVGGICAGGVDKFTHTYKLTGDGAADIVRIAEKQIGKSRTELGYTGAYCAAFINDCAYLACEEGAIPFVSGSTHGVSGLRSKILSAGGKSISASDHKAGDLRFYYCNSCKCYVHVGICYDNGNTRIEGNVGGLVKKHTGPFIDAEGHSESSGKVVLSYVRPKYANTKWTPISSTPLTFSVVANGSHALIKTNRPYGNGNSIVMRNLSVGEQVKINQTGKNSSNSIWYRTTDGYYVWDGILKYVGSDSEIQSSQDVDLTLTVKANGTQELCEDRVPFGIRIKPTMHQAGDQVHAVKEVVNKYGNIWYLLDTGKYIWSGITTNSEPTPTEPTGIEAPEQIELSVGDERNIDWTVLPEGFENEPVSFISSDPSICSVTSEGLVRGLNLGQTMVTISTNNGVSTQVEVIVEDNIGTVHLFFNGLAQPEWDVFYNAVPTGQSIPYEVTYELFTDLDPDYDYSFSDDGYEDTLSYIANESNKTVRFSGYGFINVALVAPGRFGHMFWGKVLVTDESLSVHIPESVTNIEEEAFAGTKGRFFYLPDGVRTIGANAFPDGSYVFLNTQNIVDISLNSGSNIHYFETSGVYNEDFADRARSYYVPDGITMPAGWSEWSDWVEDEIEPSYEVLVFSKMQYRWREKTTTTSYGSWSKWGQYTKKRQTITDPNLKEEKSATVWPYYYYKCSSCGQHSPVYGITCLNASCNATVPEDWHEFWLPVNPSTLTGDNAIWYTYSRKWTNDTTFGNGISFYNTNTSDYPSGTGYSYRTRKLVTTENWSDWSEWSDESIGYDENIEEEIRNLYKYRVHRFWF